MFDILEENYFRQKPPFVSAPYVIIPKFFRGKQVITIKDAAAILNVSRNLIEEVINKPTANVHEGTDYYRLKGEKRAEFKRDNPSIASCVHHIIAILESGFNKICDYLKVYVPPIFKFENLEMELGLQPTPLVEPPPPQQKSELETIKDNLLKAQKLISDLYNIWGDNKQTDKEALSRVSDILDLLATEKDIYIEARVQ